MEYTIRILGGSVAALCVGLMLGGAVGWCVAAVLYCVTVGLAIGLDILEGREGLL